MRLTIWEDKGGKSRRADRFKSAGGLCRGGSKARKFKTLFAKSIKEGSFGKHTAFRQAHNMKWEAQESYVQSGFLRTVCKKWRSPNSHVTRPAFIACHIITITIIIIKYICSYIVTLESDHVRV